MASYIWEIVVCFYEILLVLYLLYKKLGFKPMRISKLIFSALIMALSLSVLTFVITSTILRMALILVVYIFVALWAFDCAKSGRWYKAIFWPSVYLVIVAVADNVTFSLASALADYSLEELMVLGGARFQFSLVYLLILTVLVWALTRFTEPNSEFPFFINILLFVFLGVGIYAAESILDISLALRTNPETLKMAGTLSDSCYFILLMLFALLVTYEGVGIILSRNRRLKEQHQLAIAEQQQYDLVVAATESLRHWKHDYQGQLCLIGTLIEQEKYSELKKFSAELISDLPNSANLLFSGNQTMDAVISLRMIEAKRQNIRFETTLFLPDNIPLDNVVFASLVGNLLDNAIEACKKLSPENAEIRFEIKPWKKMMYIFCSNASDGNYLNGKRGGLLSTKKAEGHGLGIRRIKEIVAQAGGTYQFTPEADRFTVSIMLPLEGNKK